MLHTVVLLTVGSQWNLHIHIVLERRYRGGEREEDKRVSIEAAVGVSFCVSCSRRLFSYYASVAVVCDECHR